MSSIAIINESTSVSNSDGSAIVLALNVILPRFCKDWNLPRFTAVYVPTGQKSSIPIKVFLLDQSTIIGANHIGGYHDVDKDGIPYGKCFARNLLRAGGSILYSNDVKSPTFAKVVSHEVFEILISPCANSWWDTGDGKTLYAAEVSDPVETNSVIVNVQVTPQSSTYNSVQRRYVFTPAVNRTVNLSDWILPSWSNPNSKQGPYNYLNTLKAPFTIDKGGYAIKLQSSSMGMVTAMMFGSEVTESQKEYYSNKARTIRRRS
jgi:hypothetical protein